MSRCLRFWLVRGMHVHFGVVLSLCNFRVALMVLSSRVSSACRAFCRDCCGSGLSCAL